MRTGGSPLAGREVYHLADRVQFCRPSDRQGMRETSDRTAKGGALLSDSKDGAMAWRVQRSIAEVADMATRNTIKRTAKQAYAHVALFRSGRFSGASDTYLEKLAHELACYVDQIREELQERAERNRQAEETACE